MVRAPFYDKRSGLKKGAWSVEEDNKLRDYIQRHGHPANWRQLPKDAGISRCGKSCRLRWVNYLHPGVKKGNYTQEEDDLIIKLHQQLGNKWSVIAASLPGRTDNEIKNHWHTITKKRMTKKQNPTSSANTQLHHNYDDASNSVLNHQILESSPLSPETLSSTEHSSLSYNEPPTISAMKYCINNSDQEDHSLQASPETSEILDQYLYSCGDFWTEPFVQDMSSTLCTDMIQSNSPAANLNWDRDVPEGFIMSYASFAYDIDHGMDLFYQVMPTCQDNN